MAFHNVAPNILILRDKTCSDRPSFAPDFISHAELLLLLNQCRKEIFGMLMMRYDGSSRLQIYRGVTRVTRPPYQGGGLARLVTGDFGFFDFGNVWDAGIMMMVIMMGAKVSASPLPTPPQGGGDVLILIQFRLSLCGAEWRV